MKIEDIRKLAYCADDYDFNLQEQIKGLGLYSKYRLYFDNPKITITYCKPLFINEDKFYFIRSGSNILFKGKKVKEEIAKFEKEIDKIVESVLIAKTLKIHRLLDLNDIKIKEREGYEVTKTSTTINPECNIVVRMEVPQTIINKKEEL